MAGGAFGSGATEVTTLQARAARVALRERGRSPDLGRSFYRPDRRQQAVNALFIGVMAYLVIEFGRPQSYLPVLAYLKLGMIASLTVLVLWVRVIPRERLDAIAWMFLAFIVLSVLSVLYVVNHYWWLQTTLLLAVYFVVFFLAGSVVFRDADRRASCVALLVGLHVWLAVYVLTHDGKGPDSFLGDENDAALALNAVLSFALIRAGDHASSGRRRWIYGVAASLMVAAVIATQSRGGFVGLAICLLGWIWFSRHRTRSLVLLAIAVGTMAVLAPQTYWNDVRSISDTHDETRKERLNHWRWGWVIFKENPVLGIGVNNYPWRVGEAQAQDADYIPGWTRSFAGRAAHSMYFQLLPEYGLAGSSLFVGMCFMAFRRHRKIMARIQSADTVATRPTIAYVDSASVMLALMAVLATGAFISILYYPQIWLLLGLSMRSDAEGPAGAAIPARHRHSSLGKAGVHEA